MPENDVGQLLGALALPRLWPTDELAHLVVDPFGDHYARKHRAHDMTGEVVGL